MARKSDLIFMFVIGVLVAVVCILGWYALVQYRQSVTAMFIAFHCETTEEIVRTENDPRTIAHHVEFLICYYQGHRGTLAGTRLAKLVRRDYQHTLTNALIAYQRISTNDFHAQIEAWTQKYAD